MNTRNRILVVLALAVTIAATLAMKERPGSASRDTTGSPAVGDPAARSHSGLPRLVDLGADQCVPCKMMAPILASLKEDYAGRMEVEFIDVWKNPGAGEEYGIQVIPTQIFYSASGEELRRHTGFIGREDILAAWNELGVDLGPDPSAVEAFSRWEPAAPDMRPNERVCYLCDGDIAPETRAALATPAGDVPFCSVHCYLITFASMTEPDKSHENASVTDLTTGTLVPVEAASYLYNLDAAGRPAIAAFADGALARAAQEQGAAACRLGST